MKKKILIIASISIILILSIVLIITNKKHKEEKFYLEDKYYNIGEYISSNDTYINKLIDKKENFIIYVHNNYCAFTKPCENIFKEVMIENNIDIIEITLKDFKKTKYYKKVKYAPSIIIVKEGKIVDYLDTEKDEDLDKYQEPESFEKWLKKYIKLQK